VVTARDYGCEGRYAVFTREKNRIAVSDAERERILAQTDPALLKRWHEKAIVAASVAEVLGDPSVAPGPLPLPEGQVRCRTRLQALFGDVAREPARTKGEISRELADLLRAHAIYIPGGAAVARRAVCRPSGR
jgi:hypothetical protein